jgi:hypothetical protein
MSWGENYFEIPGLSTLTDLSAKQFYAVMMDTANALTVTAVTAVTNRPVGILQDNPKGTTTSRVAANVAHLGVCKAICSGGWTRGDRLGVTSTGALKTITETTNTTNTAYTIATALDSASDGDIARVVVVEPYLSNVQ